MSKQHRPDLTPLHQASDHDLVRRVQRTQDRAAANELIVRSLDWLEEVAAYHAARTRLSHEDRQDVQQEAVLWFLVALDDYPLPSDGSEAASAIRGFCQLVISRRFCNFLRDGHRAGRRLDRSAAARQLLAGTGEERHILRFRESARSGEDPDPAVSAEWREWRACLLAGVRELDDADQLICAKLAAGLGLTAIARDMGLTVGQVKYRRLKIRQQLLRRLGPDAA